MSFTGRDLPDDGVPLDALRRDPDLDNLRKHPEFRKILEKHKVFIVK